MILYIFKVVRHVVPFYLRLEFPFISGILRNYQCLATKFSNLTNDPNSCLNIIMTPVYDGAYMFSTFVCRYSISLIVYVSFLVGR